MRLFKKEPTTYHVYKPKEDITVYELSLIVGLLIGSQSTRIGYSIKDAKRIKNWDVIGRHFETKTITV